jgi:outer membrane receptor for ferrienterochelin and colicins
MDSVAWLNLQITSQDNSFATGLGLGSQLWVSQADQRNVKICSNFFAARTPEIRREGVSLSRIPSCLVLAFVLIGLTVPTRAQVAPPTNLKRLSLEQLMSIEVATVNAASKFDQKETSAPSYVTVVTAEEIQKYGYRTLADILESVPGFYVTSDRNYSYLGVRGFDRSDYNDRVLLLIDGHRLNDPVYGEALIGAEFPLDVDLIQRVEVVRGAGSALYGTNAFFSVINVITKQGADVQDAEVAATAESSGAFQDRVTSGHQWVNGPEVLISGSYYNSHGNNPLYFPEFDTPATNNGVTINSDGEEFHNFLASVSYRGFTLQGLYGSRTKVIPTGSFGTVFDEGNGTRTTDALGYIDLKYEHKLGQNWQVLARAGYDQTHYHGTYVYNESQDASSPYTVNQDLSWGERLTVSLDASRTFFEKHRVTFGSENQFDLKMDQSNYNQGPFFLFLDDRRHATVPALYVQDEYSIRSNLTLTAGVRWDHYYTFGSTENPRLGLIYNPLERTTFKLLYGTAFRAPNDYELYYASPPNQISSPSLRPETIRTTELVFEQYFTGHAHVEVAGFYNDIRGLITQQTNQASGLLSFANLEGAQSKGIDCELSEKWPSGWQGRISYTLQSSIDPQSRIELSNSPKDLVKVNVSAPLVRRWLFGSVDGQYTSSVDSLQDNPIAGFFVVNATLSTSELKHLVSISASAYNLFNVRYADAVGSGLPEDSIVQNGRTVRIKFTYRFGDR